MPSASAYDAARKFVREHERSWIVGWLILLAVVLGVGFGWGIVGRGAERAIDGLQARWPARVDACAELIAQDRIAEAADRLERLDAEFPAQSVKHRFDRERERLLTLLASCYVALDRKGAAFATCERLVAFDPRNWQNHNTRALAALAFGDGDLAKLALDSLLAIHPTHLPSVEARAKLAFDGSLSAEVLAVWRNYVEAYRLAPVYFQLGDTRTLLEIPSDGKPHRFDVPFAFAGAPSAQAQFETHGWSFDVLAVALVAPTRIGALAASVPQSLAREGWTVEDAQELEPAKLRANGPLAKLRRDVTGLEGGTSRVVFEVVAYKACTEKLWSMVASSYRNRLLWDELESMSKRTRIGGYPEAGSIFED